MSRFIGVIDTLRTNPSRFAYRLSGRDPTTGLYLFDFTSPPVAGMVFSVTSPPNSTTTRPFAPKNTANFVRAPAYSLSDSPSTRYVSLPMPRRTCGVQ